MTVSARGSLPSFPSSGDSSRPEMAQSALAIFATMTETLKQIKLNTDTMIKQISTVTENIEAALVSQKDSLKNKEAIAEDKADDDEKKVKSVEDKAVGFFEKLWTVISPMLLGFFMGITDLTKPLGLLQVALSSLVAFLGVKVLGSLLIRALTGTITRIILKLFNTGSKIINAPNSVINAGGAGTGTIPGTPGTDKSGKKQPPSPNAPKGRGKNGKTPTQDAPKSRGKLSPKIAAGGVASMVGGALLGTAISSEDDGTATSIAKYLGASVAVDYAIKNIGKLLPLLSRLLPVIATAASVIGPIMASAIAALGPALLVAATAFASYKAGGAIYDFAQEQGLTRPAETVIDYATGVTQKSNETYNKGMEARLAEKNKILAGTGYTAKSGGYVAPDGSIVYGKDLPIELQKKLGLKIAANNEAERISPTPKTVASTNQLDQTRQQHQMARNTPPTPPPAPTSTNVIQTNNVNNGTTIKKPPRAEPDSLSYGK